MLVTKLIIVLVAALVMLMEGAGDVGVVDGSLVTATVNVLLSVLHRCVVSSVITRLWCFKCATVLSSAILVSPQLYLTDLTKTYA